MGLKETLENNGSIFAYGAQPTAPTNGENPTINPLSTNQSNLHATPAGTAGYSLNGSEEPTVSQQYTSYNDGVVNPLPDPSTLDLDGLAQNSYTNPETGVTYGG